MVPCREYVRMEILENLSAFSEHPVVIYYKV